MNFDFFFQIRERFMHFIIYKNFTQLLVKLITSSEKPRIFFAEKNIKIKRNATK